MSGTIPSTYRVTQIHAVEIKLLLPFPWLTNQPTGTNNTQEHQKTSKIPPGRHLCPEETSQPTGSIKPTNTERFTLQKIKKRRRQLSMMLHGGAR